MVNEAYSPIELEGTNGNPSLTITPNAGVEWQSIGIEVTREGNTNFTLIVYQNDEEVGHVSGLSMANGGGNIQENIEAEENVAALISVEVVAGAGNATQRRPVATTDRQTFQPAVVDAEGEPPDGDGEDGNGGDVNENPTEEDSVMEVLEIRPHSNLSNVQGIEVQITPTPAAQVITGDGVPDTPQFDVQVFRNNVRAENFFNLILLRDDENDEQQRQTQRDAAERVGLKDALYTIGRGSQLIQATFTDEGGQLDLTTINLEESRKSLELDDSGTTDIQASSFRGDVAERSGIGGLEIPKDVTILCVPDLMSARMDGKVDDFGVIAIQRAMIDHCEKMGNRVAILDCPPDFEKSKKDDDAHIYVVEEKSPQEARTWVTETANHASSYATLYYPWIDVLDPATDKKIKVPPCGHVAGVWARTDNTRGVHKAPANDTIAGATGVMPITDGEQEPLNEAGINCIRAFPSRGIRIWGARTLASKSDPLWRYLNVRRLFNFIEQSIEENTHWAVFEPNDMALWQRLKRDITSFLTVQWRAGALFGSAPSEAFFVKCDEETNPKEQRDLGMVVVEIGIAPVKPAEFVIFRIRQWDPSDEEAA